MLDRHARDVARILVAQVVLSVLVSLVAWAFGWQAAVSALLGGSIATVANAVLAFWVLRRYRAQMPGEIVMGFAGGELVKLMTAALLFVAAFVWVEPLRPAALVAGYLVVQLVSPLLAARATS